MFLARAGELAAGSGPRRAAEAGSTIAGIALIAVSIVMAVRGFSAQFTRHLRMGWMSRGTQDAMVRLGQAGYVARAMVIAGIGIAALGAAVTYDAARPRAWTWCSARSAGHPSGRGCSSPSRSG